MKHIKAFIRPEKLDEVKLALVSIAINGLTVSTVQGFSRQFGNQEVCRGVKVDARLVPKIMLEVVVNDEKVDLVILTILSSATTGQVGDGKIIMSDINGAIRIRTNKRGVNVVA